MYPGGSSCWLPSFIYLNIPTNKLLCKEDLQLLGIILISWYLSLGSRAGCNLVLTRPKLSQPLSPGTGYTSHLGQPIKRYKQVDRTAK